MLVFRNRLQRGNCDIKDPAAWPDFSTKLSELASLQGCFQEFKIFHVSRAHNKTVDSLARTAQSFHKSFIFCWFFNSGLNSQIYSSLSNRTVVCCKQDIFHIYYILSFARK